MIDSLSSDQLRTFIAAVDEGSFSAASRKLRRAQSAVSQTIANLEKQLGLVLFDRGGRSPSLTSAGRVVLADSRSIVAGMDALKSRARRLSKGLESELSVTFDALFPVPAVIQALKTVQSRFPALSMRVEFEILGAAIQPVVEGRSSLAISGSMPVVPPGMVSERLLNVPVLLVAAPHHALGKMKGVIAKSELVNHTQIVLTDRSRLSLGKEYGVMSPHSWRLTDLTAKRSFILEGLGWGGLPLHVIGDDIRAGRLVELQIEGEPRGGLFLPLSLMFAAGNPPGPAGRWLVDALKTCAKQYGKTTRSEQKGSGHWAP